MSAGTSAPLSVRLWGSSRDACGTNRTDAELLAAHVAGDRYAFEELFYRHHRQLYRLALLTSRDPEDAADALQDAMLAAHRPRPAFRHDSAVSSWLYRIVVNACLDRLRRNKTHPTTALLDDGHLAPGDRRPDPRVDTAIVVERALMRLPVEQRAAVVAVDMQGYSVAETARMLGVPEGTVKSRCSRARSKLAESLDYFAAAVTADRAAGTATVKSRPTLHDGDWLAQRRRPAGAAMDGGAGRRTRPSARSTVSARAGRARVRRASAPEVPAAVTRGSPRRCGRPPAHAVPPGLRRMQLAGLIVGLGAAVLAVVLGVMTLTRDPADAVRPARRRNHHRAAAATAAIPLSDRGSAAYCPTARTRASGRSRSGAHRA